MAETITQSDTDSGCDPAVSCNQHGSKDTAPGNTAGTTEFTVETNANQLCFAFNAVWDVGDTYTWDSGTWTLRIEQSAANMNWAAQTIRVDEYSGACGIETNLLNINSGINWDPSTIGTYTDSGSGSSDTPASDSKVSCGWQVDNTDTMMAQSGGITPSQDIDSPFTAVGGAAETRTQLLTLTGAG